MAKRSHYGDGTAFQRSDGLWIARAYTGEWTLSGTRERVQVSARTEIEARRRLRTKMAQRIANGPPTDGTSSRTTLGTWVANWLAEHQRAVRPKTFATDRSMATRWIVPIIGRRRLEDLSPGDVRSVQNAIREAGKSSTTAHYVVALLRRILNAAKAEGYRIPDRVLMTAMPKKAANDRDRIPLDDAVALLETAGRTPGGSRWVAALLQGLRQGECLGLTWDAVDLERDVVDVSWQLQPLPYLDRSRGTFRVPDGHESSHLVGAYHLVRPKSKAGQRLVPLSPWLAAALRTWKAEAPENRWGLIWTAPNQAGVQGPISTTRDRQAWYALQDAAQVARVDSPHGRRYLLHEARHTTATLLLEAGIDAEVVRAIIGHSSIATTRGYQHVGQALARQAMEAVAERLRGQAAALAAGG